MTTIPKISQAAHAAAERYFAMRRNAPDHADRSLAEIIEGAREPKPCKWRFDGDSCDYETECKHLLSFDGWEVDVKAYPFCPACGGKIQL